MYYKIKGKDVVYGGHLVKYDVIPIITNNCYRFYTSNQYHKCVHVVFRHVNLINNVIIFLF